jgi:transposase
LIVRQPLKKLEPDATALLRLIERWRNEAVRAGRPISRIALARLTRWTSNMTALELS